MVEKPRETKTKSSVRRRKFIWSNEDNNFLKCNKVINVLRPVFTKDSRYIAIASGSTVYLINTKTRHVGGAFKEHKYDVSDIYTNEKDPSQDMYIFNILSSRETLVPAHMEHINEIISCSNHEVIFWDYVDKSIVKKFYLEKPAKNLYIDSQHDVENVYIRKSKSTKEDVLLKWNLKDGKLVENFGSIARVRNSFVVHSSGQCVAFITSSVLKIYKNDLKTLRRFEPFQKQSNVKLLTSVAFHPVSLTVAIGMVDGSIFLYHDWTEGKPVMVKLHWHHTPVNDILFTVEGNYLLSGASESVLVMWQLETQQKSYIPRLNGEIQYIFQSSDEQTIGISMSTSVLKWGSMVDIDHWKSLKFLCKAKKLHAGLSYHSKTNCVVLNGDPEGTVQFYQPLDDSVKITLDVIGENVLPRTTGKQLNPTKVTKIAFSDDGAWMATVDWRKNPLLGAEYKLKFWEFSEDNKSFTLNSLVDPPHNVGVNSLVFRPSCANDESTADHVAISTGKDGEVKMWGLIQTEAESKTTWQLLQSNHSFCGKFSEHSFLHSVQFSQDGTLMAVLFNHITLWDLSNLSHEATLKWTSPDDRIRSFRFVCNENSSYLVSSSSNALIVWDLSTCSIAWQMDAAIMQLTADPYSKYFVAFARFTDDDEADVADEVHTQTKGDRCHLYLFDASSPQPVAALPNVRMSSDNIVDAVFTKNDPACVDDRNVWSQIGRLFYVTCDESKMDFCRVGIENERDHGESKDNEDNVHASTDDDGSNIFTTSTLVKGNHLEDDDVADYVAQSPLGDPCIVAVDKIMSTPSHVLPPVDVMCETFYHSLFIDVDKERKRIKETPVQDIVDGAGDIEMNDSDEDADHGRNGVINTIQNTTTCSLASENDDKISSIKLKIQSIDFLSEGKNI